MKLAAMTAYCVTASLVAFATPAVAQDKVNLDDSVGFIKSQQADELRAAKWIGASVKNSSGEAVGDVNDLVLDKNLKVSAIVVGVGGFLGIAEKSVAVPVDKVKMSIDKDNARVAVVNVNKDALAKAPDYKYANDKTLRERLGEMGDAAAETYRDAKKAAKEGYDSAKETVSDAMSDDKTKDKEDDSTK